MTAPGRPPTDIDWETIERVADQAERPRLESQSPAELEQELREAGLDPEDADRLVAKVLAATADAEPLDDAAPLRMISGGAGAKRRGLSGSQVVVLKVSAWVAATAVAAGLMVRWFTAPPGEGTPPSAQAAQLRDQAAEACGRESWAECEAKLDTAREIDPSGEQDPRVVEERKAIAAHRR